MYMITEFVNWISEFNGAAADLVDSHLSDYFDIGRLAFSTFSAHFCLQDHKD